MIIFRMSGLGLPLLGLVRKSHRPIEPSLEAVASKSASVRMYQ